MNTPTLKPVSTGTRTEHSVRTLTTESADSTIRTSLEKSTGSVARIPYRESSELLAETSGEIEAGSLNGSKERNSSSKSSGTSAETLHSKPTETQDRESTSLSSGKLAKTSDRSLTGHLAGTLHGISAGTTSAALLGESPESSTLAVSGQSESAEEDSNRVLDSLLPASKPLRPALHETEATENLVSLEKSPLHGVSLGHVSTAALSFGRQSYKR
jgi:hypothetical protein